MITSIISIFFFSNLLFKVLILKINLCCMLQLLFYFIFIYNFDILRIRSWRFEYFGHLRGLKLTSSNLKILLLLFFFRSLLFWCIIFFFFIIRIRRFYIHGSFHQNQISFGLFFLIKIFFLIFFQIIKNSFNSISSHIKSFFNLFFRFLNDFFFFSDPFF